MKVASTPLTQIVQQLIRVGVPLDARFRKALNSRHASCYLSLLLTSQHSWTACLCGLSLVSVGLQSPAAVLLERVALENQYCKGPIASAAPSGVKLLIILVGRPGVGELLSRIGQVQLGAGGLSQQAEMLQ